MLRKGGQCAGRPGYTRARVYVCFGKVGKVGCVCCAHVSHARVRAGMSS